MSAKLNAKTIPLSTGVVKKEEPLCATFKKEDQVVHCSLGRGKAVHDAFMCRYASLDTAADGC